MSRPLAVWPSCFTLRPVPAIRAAAWGAPLGGAGTLPKSLCRAGAKNEKNVGRPRAAAVAAGGIINLCKIWYEVLTLLPEGNRINCSFRFKPSCS
jgi:hypothetical protein